MSKTRRQTWPHEVVINNINAGHHNGRISSKELEVNDTPNPIINSLANKIDHHVPAAATILQLIQLLAIPKYDDDDERLSVKKKETTADPKTIKQIANSFNLE